MPDTPPSLQYDRPSSGPGWRGDREEDNNAVYRDNTDAVLLLVPMIGSAVQSAAKSGYDSSTLNAPCAGRGGGVKAAIGAVFFGVLCGCAGMNAAMAPSDEQVQSADYGAKPAPLQFEKAIRLWALDALKDPSSLELRDISSDSTKGWLSQCVEPGIPPYTDCAKRMFYFGHLVTAKLNAKNSAGGYTGYKTYTFLFRGDAVSRHAVSEE